MGARYLFDGLRSVRSALRYEGVSVSCFEAYPCEPPSESRGTSKSRKRALGHSSVGITLDTYSHVLPGMQEDAARLVDAALIIAIEKNDAAKV